MGKRSKAENIALLKARTDALVVGIQLGMETADRTMGPDAERGAKVLEGAREGNVATHGTVEEKQARWDAMQERLNELMLADEPMGITTAREKIAREFGCSAKTVQRHTVSPI
jgi:hypothetical protein